MIVLLLQPTPFPERLLRSVERLLAVPWLPGAATLLMLLVFVASAARWTWQLFSPVASSSIRGIPLFVPSAPVHFSVADIQGADLFGAPPLTPGNLNAIPVSSLNLVLTGVVEAGKDGFALIKANGGQQEPFAIGQEVLPGARIVAVYADRVLIRHDGHVESLLLKQPTTTVEGVGSAMPAALLLPIDEIAPGHYQVPAALVRQEMANPQLLFQQTLMVPYEAGGFLIRSIKLGSVFQELGLKVGDVIRSVNGRPVNTLPQAMQTYRQLANAGAIDLQIWRNGQVQELHYQVQ